MTKPQAKPRFAASPPNPPELFGVSAAAREVGTAEQTIRRLADSGVIAHVRDASGKRLFTREAVDKLKFERT